MQYVRERRVETGAYIEADITLRDTAQDEPTRRGTRKRKKRVTPPAQQNLNDRNAKRYFVQLVNGNFGDDDLFVTLTYDNEHLPANENEAARNVKNFVRRLSYRRKKLGLPELKYLQVTEGGEDEEGHNTRFHHHLIINGMNRDTVEALWGVRGQRFGRAQTTRLNKQLDKIRNGVEGMALYMVKNPNGKHRWNSSRNLLRPLETKNDHKYSRKSIRQAINDRAAGYIMFEEKYQAYNITGIEYRFNELTEAWSIYLKMWKKGGQKPQKQSKRANRQLQKA